MASETPIQRAIRDAREGRLDSAIASLRFLVQRQPGNLDALQALGLLLTQAGQTAQAAHQLSRAVAAAPQVPAFRNNYANALMALGRHADAAEQLRKAVEADPRYERAWLGLALAYTQMGDPERAIDACERGRALKPAWPELARAHAAALEAADRIEESVTVLEAAVAASPRDADLRARLLLALNYVPRAAGEVLAAHRAFATTVASAPNPPARDRDPMRPLRIGILSGDLRTHSVGYFAEPIFAHRAADMQLVVFSANPPAEGDAMAQRFRARAERWVECAFLDDAALDRAIRDAGIDVLIELSGHTAGSRLAALSAKPAPVIVSAIGYPNTTGHPAVDYRLVDATTDPSDDGCTERPLRLSPCFLCYVPPADASAPMTPDPSAPITFGSFNLSTKVSRETIALWSSVLGAVEGSRLLIKSKSLGSAQGAGSARAHLMERLASGGIAPERVDFAGYTSGIAEHLALYGRMHIALDTTPYNGTTTTCEALWMGVPVVALEGDRHAARVGASLLRAAGLGELVARNAEEFWRIAVGLAQDRSRVAAYRSSLRDTLAASPLCDAKAYAERVYREIRSIWAARCAAT